jgi:hypothetical protein
MLKGGRRMQSHKDKDITTDSNLSTRRDFMKTAGKLAVYTPPAIMLLMHPSREAIACSPGQIRVKKTEFAGKFPFQSPRLKPKKHDMVRKLRKRR